MSHSSPPRSPRHLDSMDSDDSGYASACPTEYCASETRSPSPMLVDTPRASTDAYPNNNWKARSDVAAPGLTAEEAQALLDDVKRVSSILDTLPEDDLRAVLEAAQPRSRPLEEGSSASNSQTLVQDQAPCPANPSSTHPALDIASGIPLSVIRLNSHIIRVLMSLVGADDAAKQAWCASVGVVWGRGLSDEEDQLCTAIEQYSGLVVPSNDRSIVGQYFLLMGSTVEEILIQHESDGGRDYTWCDTPN